jgi:Bacterial SH3 domain
MAQRAIASSGQKETETAAFASLTAADIIRAPIVQRRIPVDFRPLLKPFKRAGRLCLRIERLPQGAKLSAGRRSTDNSWSLASDELEDLDYLVSSNVSLDHELTIRVMTFEDGEASTLKVLQFAVSAGDPVPAQTGRDPHGPDAVTRSQLSEMHSLFAVRESELLELRAALQRAASEKESELKKARADWERELDQKIAEAVSQSRLQDALNGEAKEADRKGRAAREERQAELRIAAERELAKGEFERHLEIERQKWQVETERLLKVARQEWKKDADRAMEAERLSWEAQSDERRKVEIEGLKGDSEKRIEAERRKLRGQADERLAKERERFKVEADERVEVARRAWQEEIEERTRQESEIRAAESKERIDAERQKWQAQADERAAIERELWKADADQRMEAARQEWQVVSDERRRADIERWNVDTDKRVEDERQRWLAEGSEHYRTEFERSRAEIESRISAERQIWQIQADEQARKDRDSWQADAEQRIETARRTCQAEADSRLAVELARLRAEAEQRIEAERQRFESEMRAVANSAAENTTASQDLVAVAHSEIDREAVQELAEERDKNRQLNAALVAEADKFREMESALAAMTRRCENAERSQTTGESRAPAGESDDEYIKGLRAEIATLRKSMANQAAELGRARASLEQSRPMHILRGPENRPLGNLRDVLQDDEVADGQEKKKKGLIRDCIMVAAVVIPLILFYPWIAAYLPQPVRNAIGVATGGLLSVEEESPIVPQVPSKKPAPAPQVSRPTATASRVLNVHASPGSKGEVLFSLPKNTTVVLLETQGNWTRIEAPADGAAKTRQGWVYSTYLRDNDN